MSTSKDILKRDDIRGLYPTQLNGAVATCIGRAVCELLRQRGVSAPILAVGYDCRHGNREIASGLQAGFLEAGGKCIELGLVSTEHVYYFCGEHSESCTAGAMVTASHNPREYNGVKFVYSGCIPFGQEDLGFIGKRVDELLALGDSPCATSVLESGFPASEVGEGAFSFQEYARHMVHLAGLDELPDCAQRKFTVVVLAGNGMGAVAYGPIAEILEKKGLKSVILEGDPDGDFPQGVPNPLLPGFMARLGEKVREFHADLGIGFDGDADRAGFVDADGAEIIPSQVLALIAEAKLNGCPLERPVVMRNLCCSQLMAELFPGEGRAELVDTPVGHGRIKQLMRSDAFRRRTVFAGEHSGHYFYPEFNYVDSGVLTSLNMLSIVWGMAGRGEKLSERLAEWRRRFVWSGEINYELSTAEETRQALVAVWKQTAAPGVERYEARRDPDCGNAQRVFLASGDYDPATAAAPDLKMVCHRNGSGWWFVLRPSGNEPKLRLNVEAWGPEARNSCEKKTAELDALIRACGGR